MNLANTLSPETLSTASIPHNNRSTAPSSAWLRLAEYGDWPHPRGLQRVSHDAALSMVRYFKSLRGRLARKFGGLPVYIGHPDDVTFSGRSGHDDTRAYAWITDLDARADGLYGAFKWSPAGADLLANAFYKFLSPRWVMEPIGNGTFQPVRLLSVGLTNQPNIPGEAIANSAADSAAADGTEDTQTPLQQTGRALPFQSVANGSSSGVDHTCGTDHHTGNSSAAFISRADLCAALGISNAIDPLEAIGELRDQSDRFYRIACDQSDAMQHESRSIANARDEHISLAVENAVLSGRIAPHEAEAWRSELQNDWANSRRLLACRTPKLKTTAIANTRTTRPQGGDAADFIALVEEHASATGQNFAHAWSALKRTQPDLFRRTFDSDC